MKLKAFLPEAWTQFRTLFRKFVKKTFVGTRAEWDALTLEEKQEYDLADFTDDVASGVPIISDSVTEGDMNAVTSNAVAKAVAKALEFEDLTSQITMADGTDGNPLFTSGSGRDPWDIFSCVRYGKLVVFSVCYGTFSGKLTSGSACFSGLPKAIAPTECSGSFDTRWFIDIDQTIIRCYFSRPSTELEATATRFQLVYFTE